MRALVLGSGAREHSLAWKICQSPLLEKLYLYGANDGFSHLGQVFEAKNFEELVKISKAEKISIVIVGPEVLLVQGIADVFKNEGIACIGADTYWAQLEGSKVFAKEFMQKHGIKTAKYEIVKKGTILPNLGYPLVLKADGLCAGKGVCVAQNSIEAKAKIEEYLDGKFGNASKIIVAEEFLEGQEISLISLFDGETLLPFVPARDFKKLKNGDKGPNTGGMGAYCPVVLTEKQQVKLELFKNMLQEALLDEKADFTSFNWIALGSTQDATILWL
jgi:phosphoribosylamine--glycine ligase